MHLEDRIKNGMTFYEHGHTDPIDIEQEKELEAQRRHCKEVMFDYNNTSRVRAKNAGFEEISNPAFLMLFVTVQYLHSYVPKCI